MQLKSIHVLFTLLSLSVDCNALDVKTTSGLVSGQTIHVLNQSVDQFIGIPFAEPPVGALRFQKPKPITKPLPGVIDATKTKNSCWGLPNSLLTFSEDCLFLNIWTQSRGENETNLKAVMFWIHGGNLDHGSIFLPGFNGSVLATRDVVFVATNYRLGSFGFLYGNDTTAPGNVGFYDQNLALRWVHESIHLFGGDKEKITIIGESAGSWSTSAQLLSPLSSGLFRRAIMQSGSILYTKSDPHSTGGAMAHNSKTLAKRLNCTDDYHWLECLRKVDAKTLHSYGPEGSPVEGTEFLPIDAQTAFNERKFNKDLDLIAGVEKNEWSLPGSSKDHFTKQNFTDTVKSKLKNANITAFEDYYLKGVNTSDSQSIRSAISSFSSDIFMKCPTYLFAKRYSEQSSARSVFFYEFTHTLLGPDYEREHGITHSSENQIVFGIPLMSPKTVSKENLQFVEHVVKYWTDFVKYGKTNAVWPEFIAKSGNASQMTTKILNPKEEVIVDHFNQCDTLWHNYYF